MLVAQHTDPFQAGLVIQARVFHSVLLTLLMQHALNTVAVADFLRLLPLHSLAELQVVQGPPIHIFSSGT